MSLQAAHRPRRARRPASATCPSREVRRRRRRRWCGPASASRSTARSIDGTSFVDEAMITGEPVPVAKGAGAHGDRRHGEPDRRLPLPRRPRSARTRCSRRSCAWSRQAQGSKLPIQALVDRVTMWFVPAVLARRGADLRRLAGLRARRPRSPIALVNAVAVLIIACPCAMGLATPTSIMVGTGRAAELGILFRKGEALQALRGRRRSSPSTRPAR